MSAICDQCGKAATLNLYRDATGLRVNVDFCGFACCRDWANKQLHVSEQLVSRNSGPKDLEGYGFGGGERGRRP